MYAFGFVHVCECVHVCMGREHTHVGMYMYMVAEDQTQVLYSCGEHLADWAVSEVLFHGLFSFKTKNLEEAKGKRKWVLKFPIHIMISI